MVERILELMKEKGVTAPRLSQDLNLSNSAVADWKRGKGKPSADTIVKLSEYFEVSSDYLLGRTDDPTPPGQWVDPPIRDDDEEIRLDEIGYALYGESQELSERDKLVLLDMAKALRARAKEQETAE